MDVLSAIVILMPIFKPLYLKFGVDEIYFAGVFLLNMYIGYLTPPVGINIFVVSGMFKVSFAACCRAYVPYFVMMMITLVLVTLFPSFVYLAPQFIFAVDFDGVHVEGAGHEKARGNLGSK